MLLILSQNRQAVTLKGAVGKLAVAAASYSHIAKGERQCVDRRVDLPEELLPVVLVHLLEVDACQTQRERRD